MKSIQNLSKMLFTAITLLASSLTFAASEKYTIDPTHSFVQFKASHLGFSWLMGRFNKIEGELIFDDQDITQSSIEVTVNTRSLDTNHAKRDKHLKSRDYIEAGKFPKATFVSRKVSQQGNDILIDGDLTFRGVTKSFQIKAQPVGHGKSPWGDYRRGYQGIATMDITEFNMRGKPGHPGSIVELSLFIEAINKR